MKPFATILFDHYSVQVFDDYTLDGIHTDFLSFCDRIFDGKKYHILVTDHGKKIAISTDKIIAIRSLESPTRD